MRQDLCARHRERHTARGSHLQRRDNTGHNPDQSNASGAGHDGMLDQADPGFRSSTDPYAPNSHGALANSGPFASSLEPTCASHQSPVAGRLPEPYQTSSSNTTTVGNQLRSPQSLKNIANPEYGNSMGPLKRSNSDETYAHDTFRGQESTRNVHNISIATYDSVNRQPNPPPLRTVRPQMGPYRDARRSHPETITTSPADYRPSPTSSFTGQIPQSNLGHPGLENGFNNDTFPPPQNFPPLMSLPPPVYPSPAQTTMQGSQINYGSGSMGLKAGEGPVNFDAYGSNGLDSNFIDPNATTYPAPFVNGDGYNRSPRVNAEDFTNWLFNDPYPHASSPGGNRRGSMSFGVNAFMEDYDRASPGQYGMLNDPMNGRTGQFIPQQHPMALNSILDPASLHAILSEEKRRDILDLIESRFTDHAPIEKQKDALFEGDRDAEDHVLSLRSMQLYIRSYWYHFHPQMPILHKPTFSADKEKNLLLIAVIAIGASCLDKMHGPDATEAGAELSNFLAWHLRGEIFKDKDFLPPAQLWVFQTLLLLEVYEKMYSTRTHHERAHIHHGTTLTLMRRGSSLIGRSALDSPPLVKDGKSGTTSNAESATSTPEQWWTHWITNEATRRVAFAAYIIDSIHATMFGHAATMVAHEMKLALPCDETLWSATSSADVARIEASLQAQGIKSMTFFDGLKNTLKGKPVRTNPFGRTAIMAGLLSVTWHMKQRDVQIHHLGALKAYGGKDVWRGPLTKAFDSWKQDFDQSISKDHLSTSYASARLDEENIFESRTVLHHLSHMAMHVDVVSCQIFAGAGRLLGRTTLPSDYDIAQKRIRSNWAPRPSARHATYYSLKFLSQVLMPEAAGSYPGPVSFVPYSARDDFLLNRPWVLYYAMLVVWSYGYAVDGPLKDIPALDTLAEQTYDMKRFLSRVGGIQAPQELERIKDRNACLGLLYILREKFQKCRWQLLHEAANLLGNCIEKLKGSG